MIVACTHGQLPCSADRCRPTFESANRPAMLRYHEHRIRMPFIPAVNSYSRSRVNCRKEDVMARTNFGKFAPLFAAGLAGLALAGCSTYGAGDYGYYGRSYPNASYRAPYSHGRGAIYTAPYGYDRGPGYSRGASSGHHGFGHL